MEMKRGLGSSCMLHECVGGTRYAVIIPKSVLSYNAFEKYILSSREGFYNRLSLKIWGKWGPDCFEPGHSAGIMVFHMVSHCRWTCYSPAVSPDRGNVLAAAGWSCFHAVDVTCFGLHASRAVTPFL